MNNISLITTLILFNLLLFENQSNAQVSKPLSSESSAIFTSFGLDPALVTTFGFARGFNISSINKNLMLSTEISIPIQFDLNDSRLKLEGHINILSFSKFNCWGGLSLIERNTKNSIHRANSLGVGIVFLTGYYGERWTIASEFGYDRSILTYIKHSSWYKTYFYTDAKDGWYGNTASHFYYGIRTGFSLAKFEITVRAGAQKTKSIINPLVPVYGILSINYRF